MAEKFLKMEQQKTEKLIQNTKDSECFYPETQKKKNKPCSRGQIDLSKTYPSKKHKQYCCNYLIRSCAARILWV